MLLFFETICVSLLFFFFPNFMRYVGIDVAKKTLAVWILGGESFSVTNTNKGFRKILKKLLPGDTLGVESTSTYHHALALFFLQQGFAVKELNPIVTKQFIRATVRKKKTDKSDAEIISKLLAQGEGHEMTEKNITNPLKKIFRVKKKLVQMRSSFKVQLTALASNVMNPKDTKFLEKMYTRLIKNITKEIEKLEEEMLKESNEEIQILQSIPGLSALSARGVYAEIGDIHRFSNKKKIVAFSGYDPKLTESGSSVYHSGKLTKRGSPSLRSALYNAAFANIQLNTVFSRYYRKKMDEGKHFTQAMNATARKILEIAYTMLKKKEMFRDMNADISS